MPQIRLVAASEGKISRPNIIRQRNSATHLLPCSGGKIRLSHLVYLFYPLSSSAGVSLGGDMEQEKKVGTVLVKRGMAQQLKGGVIMDVVNADQARIAEDAGAVAVMALERVPADIRADGGVARMSDPEIILAIMDAVSIPVMAKCRIGHFVEAQILEALGIDYIDESEVLTPADEQYHVDKHGFK